MTDNFTIVFLALGCLFASMVYRARHARTLPLPPGPRPLPLLGNVLDIPRSVDPRAFHELTKQYGDIVHLNALGQRMIILGSYSTAVELLQSRSANNSDRASSVMAELTGIEWILLLLPYGQAWRQGRKMLHRFFDSTAVSQFYPTQERQTRLLLQRLLETPDAFTNHLLLFVGATIMDATYGLDVTKGVYSKFVPLLMEFEDAFETAFAPGRYLVETFPILRNMPSWLPWVTFHRDAAVYKQCFSAMRNEPFDRTLENIRRGEGKPCMVSAMVSDYSDEHMPEEEEAVARDAAGVVYMGGADTISSSLQIFFLAMVLHPGVQQKAQAEIDSVIGRDRLPQMSDSGSLPYVQALIMELLRWKPIIGLGFPHASECDQEFRGYVIPKGSLIFASSWAISRDEKMYPDPENFTPERFLRDGALDTSVLDPRLYAFGHGRRICPGRHFAEASLFLTVASVLHTFSIKPRIDVSGVPKLPEGKMNPGLLSFPEAFECDISARSETTAALITSNLS